MGGLEKQRHVEAASHQIVPKSNCNCLYRLNHSLLCRDLHCCHFHLSIIAALQQPAPSDFSLSAQQQSPCKYAWASMLEQVLLSKYAWASMLEQKLASNYGNEKVCLCKKLTRRQVFTIKWINQFVAMQMVCVWQFSMWQGRNSWLYFKIPLA